MQKTIVKIIPNDATQKAAEFACFVQSACNSRAIIATLVDHVDAMRKADEAVVGDLRNQHPVVVAVLDKLCSLAKVQNHSGEEGNRIMDAHSACDRLRQGFPVDWEVFPLR